MEETTNTAPTTPSEGGMNWKVIGGVIAAVVVIGIVVFGMGGKSNPEDATVEGGKTSLKGLLAMEGSQKCTFMSKSDVGESSGEIYVSNGMMRGTFTSTANGQTVKSNMIVKDNTNYTWTDMTTQGFKMAFGEVPTGAGETPEQAIDVNQEYGYDCDNWSADASAFELPSDITFTDLAEMMKGQIPEGMMDGEIPEGMMPTGN